MKLYMGGAYQGQLEWALEENGLTPEDVFQCTRTTRQIDWSKPVITDIQLLFWAQTEAGIDSLADLERHWPALQDKIITLEDISAGIVPIDPLQRAWRETTGRCGVFLARRADRVVRLFCGLGTVLKP